MNSVQKWFIIAFQPAYMPGQIYFQYVVPREVEERPHTCYVCLFDRGFSEPSRCFQSMRRTNYSWTVPGAFDFARTWSCLFSVLTLCECKAFKTVITL